MFKGGVGVQGEFLDFAVDEVSDSETYEIGFVDPLVVRFAFLHTLSPEGYLGELCGGDKAMADAVFNVVTVICDLIRQIRHLGLKRWMREAFGRLGSKGGAV